MFLFLFPLQARQRDGYLVSLPNNQNLDKKYFSPKKNWKKYNLGNGFFLILQNKIAIFLLFRFSTKRRCLTKIYIFYP